MKVICDNEVYAKKSDSDYLLGLYDLVFWKCYPEKRNIWEPVLVIKHF